MIAMKKGSLCARCLLPAAGMAAMIGLMVAWMLGFVAL
jgi:hypothetical protein